MTRGEFLFTDENIFNIEEVFIQKIDRIYASTSQETHDKDPERPSSCFTHGFVGECHMVLPPSSISVKRGWKPLPKCLRTPCWSLFWSFLTTLCSVMNIGAFKQNLALARKANSTKVWLGGIFRTPLFRMILGLLALQQLWPQPNGLQEWAVLECEIYKKRHPNIEILKRSLMKAVAYFQK